MERFVEAFAQVPLLHQPGEKRSVLRSLGEKQGIGSVGEFGWGGAASTDMWIDPAESMVSIVMLQLMPPRQLGLTKKIKDAVYQALV